MLSTLLLAATLTTSMQEARLKAAVDIFLPTVRTCGPALLHHWGLPNTHKALRFAVSELPHGQRGTTAGTPLNGEQIMLFPPFFELTPEHAALVLVHEWLHTQGLGENGHARQGGAGRQRPGTHGPRDQRQRSAALRRWQVSAERFPVRIERSDVGYGTSRVVAFKRPRVKASR